MHRQTKADLGKGTTKPVIRYGESHLRDVRSKLCPTVTRLAKSARMVAMNALRAFLFAALLPTTADAFLGNTGADMARNEAWSWLSFSLLVANTIVFFLAAYVLGNLVLTRGWRVGYTRKILAVILYAVPWLFASWWGAQQLAMMGFASGVLIFFTIAAMNSHFRTRSAFLATAFAAIDRPEDRPMTLLWLLTSILAAWAVIIIWVALLSSRVTPHYIFIALFISGIGDALAEPVGLKFGRHKYSVTAWGTDAQYTRSLEGSACVFLSAVVAIVIVHSFSASFSVWGELAWNGHFLLALTFIPFVATLAEAKSPHTWDQPFIIASVALASVFINWLV